MFSPADQETAFLCLSCPGAPEASRHLAAQAVELGGVLVPEQGDSLVTVQFPTLSVALGAVTRALAPNPTEPVAALDVASPYRAEQIAAVGHPGQILLSEPAALATGKRLPARSSLLPLGRHRMRDLQSTEVLFQLVLPGRDQKFPPLRSLSAHPNNLPVMLSSFVGRDRERREVHRMLSVHRLLTLTGTGGVGKSRLALQVGADLIETFTHGVWCVELGGIPQGDLILPAVAAALGLEERTGRPLPDALAEHLRDRHLLLILDNCEHLQPSCAELAFLLLTSCPSLRMISTSRQPLGLDGEAVWRVPSLSLPHLLPAQPVETLLQYGSVRLYVERARRIRSGFALTAENAGAVASLCHRLDGIPLALELAAARVGAFSPRQILERLDRRFEFLTGGGHAATHRQKTLQAAIDWSYDLLSPDEQLLLERLSVFVGGFDLDAAEAVCADSLLRAGVIAEGLSALVDKSLIDAGGDGDQTTYRILESIREYGRTKLLGRGEAAALSERHCQWVESLAAEAARNWRGPLQGDWLERMEACVGDLRAALQWSRDRGEAQVGLRIASQLWLFWDLRGRIREGRQWLKWLLSAPSGGDPTTDRAAALNTAGYLAFLQGEYGQAQTDLQEAVELSRRPGGEQTLPAALDLLGLVLLRDGGSLDEAGALLEESLLLYRRRADAVNICKLLFHLAELLQMAGDFIRARELYAENLSMARQLGDRWNMALSLFNQGHLHYQTGRYGESEAPLRESLLLRHDLGDQRGLALCLEGLGWCAAAQGLAWRGALLLGAAEAMRERLGSPLSPSQAEAHEQSIEFIRGRLGPESLRAAAAQGRSMAQAELIAYVFRDDRRADGEVHPLTGREREIVRLVTAGLTDREVAVRLHISPRTVDTHLRNVFKKLGVPSRTGLVAWAFRHGLSGE